MGALRNSNFEADWSEEKSHHCWVFPVDGHPFEQEIGNIFSPPGWTVWFRHKEGDWSQPECRDARSKNPDRMRSGEKGFLCFTFGRKQDAGLMQQVSVTPGTKVKLSIWAHAWSNHKDDSRKDAFPNPDDPRWSEGAGKGAYFALEGSVSDDATRNFTFWVGIDPTGGTNPFADTVVWGKGAHIYNVYAEVPPVETVAQANTITVFTRSRAIWPFKHNDAYWDDAQLVAEGEVVEPPPEKDPDEEVVWERRGVPREQYQRVYVLLPSNAGKEWAKAIVEALWDKRPYTIGRSADDAGVGALDNRVVIAVNPAEWGPGEDGTGLEGFFNKYYPGVVYKAVEASSPRALAKRLLAME
jgi:hypothetical protein